MLDISLNKRIKFLKYWLHTKRRRITCLCFRTIELILFFGILLQGKNLYFSVTDSRDFSPQKPPLILSAVTERPKINQRLLSTFDPFYRSHEANVAEDLSRSKSERYHLKLFGTRIDGNGKSSAILQTKGGEQKLFAMGDKIYHEAVLSSIYVDRVDILTAHGNETIYLDNSREVVSAQFVNIIEIEDVPLYSNITFISQSEIYNALQEVNMRAFTISGLGVGLEVLGAKDFEILKKIGLRQGDVLYMPDGSTLHSKTALLRHTNTYSAKSSMKLIVYRPSEDARFKLLVG